MGLLNSRVYGVVPRVALGILFGFSGRVHFRVTTQDSFKRPKI